MVTSKKTGPETLREHAVRLEPSDALIGRIMRDAGDVLKPSVVRILWPFGPVWKPALALSIALLLGIGAGFAIPSGKTDNLTYEIEAILGS